MFISDEKLRVSGIKVLISGSRRLPEIRTFPYRDLFLISSPPRILFPEIDFRSKKKNLNLKFTEFVPYPLIKFPEINFFPFKKKNLNLKLTFTEKFLVGNPVILKLRSTSINANDRTNFSHVIIESTAPEIIERESRKTSTKNGKDWWSNYW